MPEDPGGFIKTINSLGLPGWVLVFTVVLVVLKYLGILPVLVEGIKSAGASISGGLSAKQTLMARLIDKSLDQNGGLIDFIKDQLLGKVEDLSDKIERVAREQGEKTERHTARIASLETHIRMITYHLTEQTKSVKKSDDNELFKIISELQDKVGILEGELAQRQPPSEETTGEAGER